MKAFVGVTDSEWYGFLSSGSATEANFWQPKGARTFRAVPPGSPFFFKTHYPHNRIVGGGLFSGWSALRVSEAWEFFGQQNGFANLEAMRTRILRYRGPGDGVDPTIGCILLRDMRFFEQDVAPPAPRDWKANLVQGRSYEIPGTGSFLAPLVEWLLGAPFVPDREAVEVLAGGYRDDLLLRRERVGQMAFKALVQEAYSRRCAVTGDRIVPVLEAAHIRPVSLNGENRVDNGLLLRSDLHTLFDRGYLSVHPSKRTLLVSPRLRAEWGNGDEFYQRAASGRPIATPSRRVGRPNSAFLSWHAEEIFLSTA